MTEQRRPANEYDRIFRKNILRIFELLKADFNAFCTKYKLDPELITDGQFYLDNRDADAFINAINCAFYMAIGEDFCFLITDEDYADDYFRWHPREGVTPVNPFK